MQRCQPQKTQIFSDFTLWGQPVVLSLTIFRHNWRDCSQLWIMPLVSQLFHHGRLYMHNSNTTVGHVTGRWQRSPLIQCGLKIYCHVILLEEIGSTNERHYSRREYNLPVRVIRMVLYFKICLLRELEQIRHSLSVPWNCHVTKNHLHQVWKLYVPPESRTLLGVLVVWINYIAVNFVFLKLHMYNTEL